MRLGEKKVKKLSFKIITSFILTLLLVITFNGRGYTKDDLEVIKYSQEYYYDILSKSVVQLCVIGKNNNAFGTGFFVDDKKTIVTNYHVVKDAETIYFRFKDEEYKYKAKMIGFDKLNDIAILTSDDEFDYKPLSLTTNCKKSQIVYSCGFSSDYIMTSGNVIDTNSKYKNNNYIDISNLLSRGNSGGPIINRKGEVIGMTALGCSTSTSLVPSYKIINRLNKI